MHPKPLRVLTLALILSITGLSTPCLASASPAAVTLVGGAASPEALRDAFLAAARAHRLDRVEALFSWIGQSRQDRAEFGRFLAGQLRQPISDVVLADFKAPMKTIDREGALSAVKKFIIVHPSGPDGLGSSVQFSVGRSDDRFYVVFNLEGAD